MAARKSRAKKKQKRTPVKEQVSDASPDVQDQLDSAIAVVRTVVDAINEKEYQHLAMVLLEYALEPLLKVKEKLEDMR